MRIFAFSKRNIKEILRDPISLMFNFIFPILMLILFFCFIFGKSEEKILIQMPMFLPKKIIPAIAIFSFSFLSLFGGMMVAKDKTTSFIQRLKMSPLKPFEMLLGYLIPLFIISIIQTIIVYLLGTVLSFFVDESIRFTIFSSHSLLAILINVPISLLFITIGILLGLIFNDKSVGGITSVVINISAIFGGMFMPLQAMGGFKYVAQALPFYHAISLSQDACLNTFASNVEYYKPLVDFYSSQDISVIYNILDTWYMHLVFILGYLIIISIATIIVFKRKLEE